MKTKKEDKRFLKIYPSWRNNKKVPKINLQGLYLKNFNFDVNDQIEIVLSENKITITKLNA